MKTEAYDRIYLVGIGGIGMSALARWFLHSGKWVGGYDRTPTALTRALQDEGMVLHYEDDVDLIPAVIKDRRDGVLVIYTPAVPSDHRELGFFRKGGYTVMKRSEVLGAITADLRTVAIAGTHGKTTTSTLIAHILKSSGVNMVAFLGGIATNYNSNLLVQGEASNTMIVVAEADEFDRSFLRLFPDIAVVTSADPDHLDIYGTHDALRAAFEQFVGQVRPGGALVVHDSIAHLFDAAADRITVHRYGVNRGQFFASNVVPIPDSSGRGLFAFDLNGFGAIEKVRLGIPGFHNVENAVAAAVAAHCCGVDTKAIIEALGTFSGVKRRFEFILKKDSLVFVDDYAHHPAEIQAFLGSLKAMYPDKKLTVIFQPHLYSRTRDFASGFAESLSHADELLLMDIYPAREKPIPGVDAGLIFEQVRGPRKVLCNKENVLSKVADMDVEVLATVGAGDIDTFVEPIKDILIRKYAA